MGFRDAQMFLADGQDLTAAVVGTPLVSSDVIDLGEPGVDALGNTVSHDAGYADMGIQARITQTVTSAGAATAQLQLVMADDEAISQNVTILLMTDAIPKAKLVDGYRFALTRLPLGLTQRYLVLRTLVGTAVLTAGKLTASLVPNPTA